MYDIQYPKESALNFRQYLIIRNNTDKKETVFNYCYDPDEPVVIHVFGEDYTGQVMRIIHECPSKVLFLISNICRNRYLTKAQFAEDTEELMKYLRDTIPNFDGFDVHREVTGYDIPFSEVGFNFPEPLCDVGYSIDSDAFNKWMKKHNISIGEFLTEKKYMVIIEHKDNNFFKRLIESGFINKDAIENWDEILETAKEEDDEL